MDKNPISRGARGPANSLGPAGSFERAAGFKPATLTLAKNPMQLPDQGKRAVFPGHGGFWVSSRHVDFHQESRVMWTKCGHWHVSIERRQELLGRSAALGIETGRPT
jgi:hypothetical protein